MNEDSEHPEPAEAHRAYVASAREALQIALKSERTGSIALARTRLASAYAESGLHAEAVAEYEQLLNYLHPAEAGGRKETQRRPDPANPSARPRRTPRVDLGRIETLARLKQVESLLILGRRDDARAGLLRVAPMCRGFRRKLFRKKLTELRDRLEQTTNATNPNLAFEISPPESGREPAMGPDSTHGRAANLPERLTAADATLGRGDAQGAAREALGIVADCGEDDHCRAQARQVLGMALDVMGRSEESLAVMKLSLTDYLAVGNFAQAANLAIPVAIRLEASDQRVEAIALIRRCLTGTEGSLPDSVRSRLMADLGPLLDQNEDRIEARHILESAIEMAVDSETKADAEHGLAVSLGNDAAADAEQSVEALALLDAAKFAYSELGYLGRVAGCEHEAAALLGRLRSFPAAEGRYQKALAVYRELGPVQIDDATRADEVADCEKNIRAASSRVTSDPTMFRSGGHAMRHDPNDERQHHGGLGPGA